VYCGRPSLSWDPTQQNKPNLEAARVDHRGARRPHLLDQVAVGLRHLAAHAQRVAVVELRLERVADEEAAQRHGVAHALQRRVHEARVAQVGQPAQPALLVLEHVAPRRATRRLLGPAESDVCLLKPKPNNKQADSAAGSALAGSAQAPCGGRESTTRRWSE